MESIASAPAGEVPFEIERLADAIGVTDDRAKSLLLARLESLRQWQPLYESYDGFSEPSAASKRLVLLVEACRSAEERGTPVPSRAIPRPGGKRDDAAQLLRYHAGARLEARYIQKAIQDGRADRWLDEARSRPTELASVAAAAAAAARTKVEPGRGGARHQRDFATRALILDLAATFSELTGTKPSISYSVHEDGAYGRFLEFLLFVMPKFGRRMSRDGIRQAWRRLQQRPADWAI